LPRGGGGRTAAAGIHLPLVWLKRPLAQGVHGFRSAAAAAALRQQGVFASRILEQQAD